jgi:hypothetical protein
MSRIQSERGITRSEVVPHRHQKCGESARRAWRNFNSVAYRKYLRSHLHMQNKSRADSRSFHCTTHDTYPTTISHPHNTTQPCRPILDAARNLHLHHLRQKQNQTPQQWASTVPTNDHNPPPQMAKRKNPAYNHRQTQTKASS